MAPDPTPPSTAAGTEPHRHGHKGVWYAGDWLDIEDCDGAFTNLQNCSGCNHDSSKSEEPCPRSLSRPCPDKDSKKEPSILSTTGDGRNNVEVYDVMVVGAGCVGATIARELSRYKLSVLWVEAADDVSQGATKGNSGIVHSGYDDRPGSVRARYCWRGNQMFAELDRELRFGYQKNGSLVVAFSDRERAVLRELMLRGKKNGVQNLRIVERDELRQMEPFLAPAALAALYSPDAGNVIPYEFAIALAENAVDNGVDLRIRRELVDVRQLTPKKSNKGKGGGVVVGKNNKGEAEDGGNFEATLDYWEPSDYIGKIKGMGDYAKYNASLFSMGAMVFVHYLAVRAGLTDVLADTFGGGGGGKYHMVLMGLVYVLVKLNRRWFTGSFSGEVTRATPLPGLVKQAGRAVGGPTDGSPPVVDTKEMLVGGSGSCRTAGGTSVLHEKVRCRYVVNCAGGAADQVAGLIGDSSFKIKPRVGDYILLKKKQGHLAKHTLFPCPDPVLGKGVLVQTTLWGNLILGPTARDMDKPGARDMSPAAVQEYILSKCKQLVPSFDPRMTIHAFCGARAKSDRGDWIIEPSKKNSKVIHVAGIDSPGLAGAPAIALDVVKMLVKAGLKAEKDPAFNPNRAPIITPKAGLKGLKMGLVDTLDSDGSDEAQMAKNVICKCEKVTELEVVRAMRRSLPIDSSQGIRKRTRAGMGSCQADPDNYNCEARVRAIIARENGVPVDQVGGRPWPATSTLPERWISDEEREELVERMKKA